MRKFILGSDWWTDCDDAVAIRLLCNAHRKKRVELLGISMDACMADSAASLAVFTRACGVHIPLGLDTEATGYGGKPSYQHRLAMMAPELNNVIAEDAVKFYRRLIAANNQVELLEIGFPQVLTALLASGPDEISPLSGKELVKQRVPMLWMMAGKWDEEDAYENNFGRTRQAAEAAAILCAEWPVPVTFLGWEVGNRVITGSKLPPGDILKQVLIDHGSANGRDSWDPMLADLALTGDCTAAGYRTVTGRARVNPENGHNFFTQDPAGPHRFVVKTQPDAWYTERIDRQLPLEL